MALNYPREVERLAAELRARDKDPACASWPVEDAYGRISAVRRVSDSDKPIVQIFYTLASMLERQVRLGAIHMDENVSAWQPDGVREGWAAMTVRLVAGECTGMAATFVDRLMRDNGELEDLVRACRKQRGRDAGFTVFDVDADRLYRSWMPDDMKALRDRVTASNHDSAVKSRKLRRALAARIAAGHGRNGAAPFGHRWGACWIDDGQLAAERAAVRWGILRVTDGGTWGEVARRWNADGLTPRQRRRKGKMADRPIVWHSLNVKACLSLPRHAGLLVHNGRVVGTIVDEDGPVVSLPEWHAFESVIGGRTRGRRRGDAESRYFASGSVWCGGTREDGSPCDTLLVGAAQSGTYADGERRYGYRCPPRGCRGVCVDGRATEEYASLLTAKAIVSGDNLALLAHVGHSDRLAELDKLVADMEAAVSNVERQHDAARADRRPRLADRLERFERQLGELLDERDELRRLERQERLKPSDVDELCALWNNPATPADVRRTIIRQCVPGGFYVRPVGRAARLRGEQIFTRFYTPGEDS